MNHLLSILALLATTSAAADLLECGRTIQRELRAPIDDDVLSFFIESVGDSDPGFVRDVMIIAALESRINPAIAGGPSGEVGMMQLLPSTAKWACGVTKEQLRVPADNIKAGACYYRKMLSDAGGDAMAAVASYNMGPRAIPLVKTYKTLPAVTANYVWRFLRLRSLTACQED